MTRSIMVNGVAVVLTGETIIACPNFASCGCYLWMRAGGICCPKCAGEVLS